MRQQRHPRLNTEATHAFRRHQGDLRQLFRRRIVIDIGIGDKGVAARQQQRIHRPGGADAVAIAKQRLHHAVVIVVLANSPADHRIRFTAMNHDGANHRGVANHRPLRLLLGNAAALHQLVVLAPVLFKPRVGFIIDDLKVNAGLDLQAQLLDAHFNHARAPHQNRFGQSQRHQLLGGVQHPGLLPFRQHHALRLFARLREDRLHKQVGFIDELAQLLDIGVKIGDRARRHTGIHRRLRHRGGDLDDQPRVEWFRNDVLRTKA